LSQIVKEHLRFGSGAHYTQKNVRCKWFSVDYFPDHDIQARGHVAANSCHQAEHEGAPGGRPPARANVLSIAKLDRILRKPWEALPGPFPATLSVMTKKIHAGLQRWNRPSAAGGERLGSIP